MTALLVRREGGVVHATLNRPDRKNAINGTLLDGLRGLLDDVERSTDDRVLVITGAGDAFCSGADLRDRENAALFAGGHGAALTGMRLFSSLALRLHRLTKPTIAAVNGVAAGAGCNLALACDLVVAAAEARFSQIFVRRGLVLDFGGTWLLPRLVGLQRAKELAFLGDMVSAERAEAIGLINSVVAGTDLAAAVDELARRVAAGPPVALRLIKAGLNQSLALSLEEALEVESVNQAACLATADVGEAMRAFAERREPKFSGR